MLCAAGAFQIWRRDLVEELNGWSSEFTCEDIEFTFRVHRALRERGRPYRIACLPDCIGVTEGPDSVRKLVSQRERWQRVILETCWANRRMWFNPRYGTVGMLGLPYYLLSEVVAPVFEVLAIATLVAGVAAGLVDWWEFGVSTLAIMLANSAVTTGALLMFDLESRAYRLSSIVRLLALMPLEMLVYRPVMAWARVKGSWRYARGDKGWHNSSATSGWMPHEDVEMVEGGGAPARDLRDRGCGGDRLVQDGGAAAPRLWASDRGCSRSCAYGRLRGVVRRRGARRRLTQSLDGDLGRGSDTSHRAIPTASCSSATDVSSRSTGVSATCSASIARSFSGRPTHSPFGPPEHRHEIETWHSELEARREAGLRAHLLPPRGRSHPQSSPLGGSWTTRRRRQLVTVRDASASHRRERRLTELSARDPETGLLDRREFEERLGHAVRRARKSGTNVTVVLAQIATGGGAVAMSSSTGGSRRGRPARARSTSRATSSLDREAIADGSFRRPTLQAASRPVSRWWSEIADVGDVSLTAGVCDIAGAGDAISLYALADRALADARRKGLGETAAYEPPAESRPLALGMV